MLTVLAKPSLDTEYKRWLQEIDFYKGELSDMQRKLEDFLPTFYSRHFASRIEQFQNRFIRQREVIDILRHEVKSHENDIERLRDNPSPGLRDKVSRMHMRLRSDFNIFVDLFIELEQDFNDFLA